MDRRVSQPNTARARGNPPATRRSRPATGNGSTRLVIHRMSVVESKGQQPSEIPDPPSEADIALALRQDIRLLGRVLGETLRRQEGDSMFDVVERIRKTAIRFRRDGDSDARAELARLVAGLEIEAAISVVRAFTYFSHLANIAEDRQFNRRARLRKLHREPPEPGSLALALSRLKQRGVTAGELADVLRTVAITPVLTAHPTEVQRKSILDRHMCIARLLAERGRSD